MAGDSDYINKGEKIMNITNIKVIHDRNNLISFLYDASDILESYIEKHKKLIQKEYPHIPVEVIIDKCNYNCIIEINGKSFNSDNYNDNDEYDNAPEYILWLEDQIEVECLV
jgi:hypothetical protein